MSQLRKNVLLMGGLGAAAIALGLFAYYGVAKPEERETERKEVDQKLFATYKAGEKAQDGGALPNAVFTSVVVKAKGDTTALEKKDGAWRLTQPVQAPADTVAVEAVTNALNSTKFKDLIEENPTDADLEKYGLKDPKFTVTAYAYVPDADGKPTEDAAHKREVTLYGGIENTFDGSMYVRREGEKAIHSMEGGARFSLEKSSFDLRNKDVLAIDEAKLKRIQVKAKDNSYVLERDAQRVWRLVKPMAEVADGAALLGMLAAIKNERALSFPKDDAAARKAAGLDSAQVDATFTEDSGGVVRLRLNKADKTLALIERGEAVLAEVPDVALTDLDKSAGDLIDKTVLQFKRDDVAKVSFAKRGDPEIVAEKVVADGGPEEWRVTAPQVGPAKKWKLSSLLWNLSSLKATTFGEAKPKSWAKFGLDKPDRTASLFDKDGKLLATLLLGKAVEKKPNMIYARGSRDQVLEVDSSRLTDLPAVVAEVLDLPPPVARDGGAPTALKN